MSIHLGAGEVLAGRYRVERPLGQGAMAQVVEAFDLRLERLVAVKLLRPELSAHPEMRARFEYEARAAARLSHPNVVAVYDTGEADGVAFLVTERLTGPTLAERIADGPLRPGQVIPLGTDVLGAVGAAHQRGLVHRDIKPGNILLTEDGRAKVADFGIAKALSESSTSDSRPPDLTEVGMVIGTPAYLAPERLRGQPASVRSDLFAVGVVLFEALTGHKPGTGVSWPAEVPPQLARVIDRARSDDPARRFASAAEMSAALTGAVVPRPQAATARMAAASGIGASTVALPAAAAPVPPVRPSRRRAARRRRMAGLTLAALAALVLMVVLLATAGGNPGPARTPGRSTVQTGTVRTTSTTTTTSSTTTTTTTTTTTPPPPTHPPPGPGPKAGPGHHDD